MDIWLEGHKVALSPKQALGKGGEADVFDLGDGRALKVFKTPSHPDYAGLPHEQAAAKARLDEHQRKLRVFPSGLPGRVVTPQALATDARGQEVLGYAMRKLEGVEPLRRWGEPAFRRAGGCVGDGVTVLRGLHQTLGAVHASRVIVGDFNDLNVLVAGTDAYLIDADSFQFGAYRCAVFTERFLDPLRLPAGATALTPVQPASVDSDWFAFTVMVMQSLLGVGPYGGIHRPKAGGARLGSAPRMLQRVTVFHPEVQYPKPAFALASLPDDVLHHLHRVFVEDQRGAFPRPLLEGLRFQRCPGCGVEHARTSCPACQPHASAAATPVASVRGQVVATRKFSTRGVLVHACAEGGVARWLYHAEGLYRREDGRVVLESPLNPSLRWALCQEATLMGAGGQVTVFEPGRSPQVLGADVCEQRPVFAANARFHYWAAQGALWRNGLYGPERLGDVLEGQTRVFVGPRFGLGFHRAGGLRGAFLFDAERKGLRDGLTLPWPQGPWVDAEALFDGDAVWLFLAEESGGRTVHHCIVVGVDGAVRARGVADAGDGSWLGALRGKCAMGQALFCATDAGLVRVEARHGQLTAAREFPDTEPFVDSGSQLLLTREGLLVVGTRDLTALRMT
ncbi:hypothetical protein KRR26_13890 [Corallococcus sp. M34]|uniref:hypothetical protein n=1 Tax=Citreicoccus inhibens TaxID=2849499 RepID=UPI001C2246B8|nr:hypothetical protein [Citreicoccus inhibens]MBU8896705.1 hypothetical protein [Citreicoccus inhibens]